VGSKQGVEMEYNIRTLEQLRPILVGFRKQAGLTQMAVASLLGVSQQSYAKIEANPAATSVERLFKILGLLGGDIILSERIKNASGGESIGCQLSSSSLSTSQSIKQKARKTPEAPAKLIPPSKKTESW
jgi:HTH-type transcriptional regulator/antitoxin HipB